MERRLTGHQSRQWRIIIMAHEHGSQEPDAIIRIRNSGDRLQITSGITLLEVNTRRTQTLAPRGWGDHSHPELKDDSAVCQSKPQRFGRCSESTKDEFQTRHAMHVSRLGRLTMGSGSGWENHTLPQDSWSNTPSRLEFVVKFDAKLSSKLEGNRSSSRNIERRIILEHGVDCTYNSWNHIQWESLEEMRLPS